MSIFSKFKKLSGADRVLDARSKITAAVEAEKGKLLQVIPERFAAESALRDAEAANALGEPVDIEAARRRLASAVAAVGQHSTVLAGLRHRLAEQVGDLDTQYKAVRGNLPDHIERLKSDFAAEFAKGVAAWSALLSKRVAIETLVGKLTLPEPRPEALELPAEISAPWKAAEQLKAGIDDIAGFGRVAMAPSVDAMRPGGHRPYDEKAVYRISHPASGLEPGTLCTDAVFLPGMLEHLHNIGYCEAAGLQAWQGDMGEAERAVQRIATEEREQDARAEHERNPPGPVKFDPENVARAVREQQRPVTDLTPESGRPGKEWSGAGTKGRIR
jgi:hypothetical protein